MTDQQPHTPATEEVREATESDVIFLELGEFDRFLAARDARIEAAAEQRGAERAWDEGWNAGYDDHVWEGALEYTPNPYRADQMEGDE